jgi:glutamate racemase
MREEFNIPVISMEPAVRPALAYVKEGRILVLATQATVSQQRYLALLDKLDAKDKVISVGCTGLVEMIESGQTAQKQINKYLDSKLSVIEGIKIDAVVIGCTHYSFIHEEIKRYIDNTFHTDCKILDGRHGTALQLKRILQEKDILCENGGEGSIEYYTSGHNSCVNEYQKLFKSYKP